VARGDRQLGHALAVDEGAVRAAQIDQDPAALGRAQLGVARRRVDVAMGVEGHLTIGVAAELRAPGRRQLLALTAA
jgi:hypothetical protein